MPGEAFTDFEVIRIEAPHVNAVKISTTLGSNVDGDDKKITSLDVILQNLLWHRNKQS